MVYLPLPRDPRPIPRTLPPGVMKLISSYNQILCTLPPLQANAEYSLKKDKENFDVHCAHVEPVLNISSFFIL